APAPLPTPVAESAPVEPAPTPAPSVLVVQPPPATVPPAPAPDTTARPAPPVLHLDDLLRAQPVAIGRREGLPGHPEMVLVDALRGDERIWFRFKLEGGAAR